MEKTTIVVELVIGVMSSRYWAMKAQVRESERVTVRMEAQVRERERERVCVCVCVSESESVCIIQMFWVIPDSLWVEFNRVG